MSNAIKELHDYLAKSPSVVYPQDVLEYLPAVESENAKLRELAKEACETARDFYSCVGTFDDLGYLLREARELGVEVDG